MLIIVESPTKAKKIQEILGKLLKNPKYADLMSQFVAATETVNVIASQGHLMKLEDGLADKNKNDKNDKNDKNHKKMEKPENQKTEKKSEIGKTNKRISGIDLDNNFKPIYQIDPSKTTIITKIKDLYQVSKNVLFATDPDREGEGISWQLTQILKIDPLQARRLVFYEITEKGLLDALKSIRPLDMSLVASQQARQVLDKLLGFVLSPLLWKALGNYKLSAGRVQSPALRLIAKKQQEIDDFVPSTYWQLSAK